MDKFTFKIKPFPDEVFAPDAKIVCEGAPVTLLDRVIGHVVEYEIVHGDLYLTVDQDV